MEVTRRCFLRDRHGFSLVEVMVALVIGAIGLMALSGLLVNVINTNRRATDISIATALARQKIEQIKLTPYNSVVSQVESSLNPDGKQAAGGRYIRMTDVAVNAAGFNTKTVSVSVFFSQAPTDTTKRAVITTIIYP